MLFTVALQANGPGVVDFIRVSLPWRCGLISTDASSVLGKWCMLCDLS